MKKNGFTLVELLAVLVIVSIITLIATPNVINLMKQGREKKFVEEANSIVDNATYMYKNDRNRSNSNIFECNEDKTNCKITLNKLDKGIESNDPYGYEYKVGESFVVFQEYCNSTTNVCQTTVSVSIKSCSEKDSTECHYICSENAKNLTTDNIKSNCTNVS